MDNPYDQYAAWKAANKPSKKRKPNRKPREAPRDHRSNANRGNNNQGGGGEEGSLANRYGRYDPGAYDPNVPYNQPLPGKSSQRTAPGKMMGEQDPEALLASKLGRAGIAYSPFSPHPYDQFMSDQVQNMLMGLRTARMDRANLPANRYFNNLPILAGLGGDFGDDMALNPSGGGGRRPRGKGGKRG